MSLPEEFVKYISRYNPPWLDTLTDAMEGVPTVAVRYNPRKLLPGIIDESLRRVPWCGMGRLLPERPLFTFDPAMHQGIYYVQDASSMFVGHVVRSITAGVEEPLRVLDACAAPGGKTTAVIDALPVGSLVVANEFVAKRAAILRENIAKWGSPLVAVTQGDTACFGKVPEWFDIIVADVPCSGEGMMRKDAEAVSQWSPALVNQCARLQREIVDNLWPALKPGGYMIYSTCTFNPEEDEHMLGYLYERYGAESVSIPVDEAWRIAPALVGDMPAYRFIPGLIEGEGLFMGVVRKPSGGQSGGYGSRREPKKSRSKRQQDKQIAVPKDVSAWIRPEYKAEIKVNAGAVVAIFNPDDSYPATLELGELKGRDIVPSAQLALSVALNRGAFPNVEVDLKQAIDYLRCEAVVLSSEAPRGHVLLTYCGSPLGFVKNLGNRANNLYQRSWRILSRPR